MAADVTHEVTLELPTVPACVRIKGSRATIDLADLSEDTIRALGQRWTEALIAKAQGRRQKGAA